VKTIPRVGSTWFIMCFHSRAFAKPCTRTRAEHHFIRFLNIEDFWPSGGFTKINVSLCFGFTKFLKEHFDKS